jgi:hypothetical protein
LRHSAQRLQRQHDRAQVLRGARHRSVDCSVMPRHSLALVIHFQNQLQ